MIGKDMMPANNQKKAEVAIFVSVNVHFTGGNKKLHFIMIGGLILQEDLTE